MIALSSLIHTGSDKAQRSTAWYGSAVAAFILGFSICIALHCGDALRSAGSNVKEPLAICAIWYASLLDIKKRSHHITHLILDHLISTELNWTADVH